MNVDILDSKVFNSLNAESVISYLRGQGWTSYGQVGEDSDIDVWDYKTKDEAFRVRVPLNRSFVDYDESFSQVVKTIASATKKSQLEILEDLSTIAQGDIVRITTCDPFNPSSFTIPLMSGVDLFERARKLASAAALSAEDPKPVYSTYRSKVVTAYLDGVRLGQTERGSYRVKLISPVPIQPPLFEDDRKTPFGRSAVIVLMDGLDALDHISKRSLRSGYRFEEFNEAVMSGVSANLCEALTRSNKHRVPDAPLEIDVTWSQAIKLPKTSTTDVEFNTTQLSYIEKAAKDFREHNEEIVSLEGFVVALSREPKSGQKEPPRITLATIVDDRLRKVHISVFVPDYYDLALLAHKQNSQLRVFGTLKQSGRFLWLENAQGFDVSDPLI